MFSTARNDQTIPSIQTFSPTTDLCFQHSLKDVSNMTLFAPVRFAEVQSDLHHPYLTPESSRTLHAHSKRLATPWDLLEINAH